MQQDIHFYFYFTHNDISNGQTQTLFYSGTYSNNLLQKYYTSE